MESRWLQRNGNTLVLGNIMETRCCPVVYGNYLHVGVNPWKSPDISHSPLKCEHTLFRIFWGNLTAIQNWRRATWRTELYSDPLRVSTQLYGYSLYISTQLYGDFFKMCPVITSVKLYASIQCSQLYSDTVHKSIRTPVYGDPVMYTFVQSYMVILYTYKCAHSYGDPLPI